MKQYLLASVYIIFTTNVNAGTVNMAPIISYLLSDTTPTSNNPPEAEAGEDFSSTLGSIITLNGSESFDPDGDPLNYEWKKDSTIIGDEVVITVDNLTEGTHTFILTIKDDNYATDSDNVTVTIYLDTPYSTTKIKKTGQTISYDFNGDEIPYGILKDDGYYQRGFIPSYTRDANKEVVTDNITGLMWQDDAEVTTLSKPWVTRYNYDDMDYNDTSGDTATTYCSNLALGNYYDWRLPTIVELQDIVVDGKYDPSIDITAFENYDILHKYWSSTASMKDTSEAWLVGLYKGMAYEYTKQYNEHVRCVRAGYSLPNAEFTKSNGMVTDSKTWLVWQDDVVVNGMSWQRAIDYCESLTLGDNNDWRLPNNNELLSIVDYTKTSPSISPIFQNTSSLNRYYWSSTTGTNWSSTTSTSLTDQAGYVNFGYGSTSKIEKYNNYVVRCVRAGL